MRSFQEIEEIIDQILILFQINSSLLIHILLDHQRPPIFQDINPLEVLFSTVFPCYGIANDFESIWNKM